MKLSIIIPYYNTYEETVKLLDVLIPQLTEETEVIIVDDGCNEKRLEKYPIKVIHLKENSGGASKPRNIGIDNAKGEYITFIDSDDMISEDYIKLILINLKTDIMFLSWQSTRQIVIMRNKPPAWNCAVWCRVYRKSIIGNIRFDENLKIAEDWKFNEQIKYNTYSSIKKIIYYYNSDRKGSLTNG